MQILQNADEHFSRLGRDLKINRLNSWRSVAFQIAKKRKNRRKDGKSCTILWAILEQKEKFSMQQEILYGQRINEIEADFAHIDTDNGGMAYDKGNASA